jgi:DNA primase
MTTLENLLKITRLGLKNNQQAKEYLKSRGINKESINTWKIGYLESLEDLRVLDKEDLKAHGLLIETKSGKYYSPLVGYITFPLFNQYDKLIGFSGRPPLENSIVKEKGLRKYWHTKIDKRNFLFGLNLAKREIQKVDEVIVVEGQFDSITAVQYGIKNIVSTQGTALTENQVILLERYAKKAYVLFDTDEAGTKAIEQLAKYTSRQVELIPRFLPDETVKQDPDSYIKQYGKEAFLRIIQGE